MNALMELELSKILKIKDKEQQAPALLAYGGQRIDRTIRVYGVDSKEYDDALARWSKIIRAHLAYSE